MGKQNKPKSYKGHIDYEDIFSLYELGNLTRNQKCARYKTIREYLKKYLAKKMGVDVDDFKWKDLKFKDLSKPEQAYFQCYEIKTLMLNRYCTANNLKKIEKNLKKRIEEYGTVDENVIADHNNRLIHLHSAKSLRCQKDDFIIMLEDEKEQLYAEFCDEWRASLGTTPIDYETFCKYPHMSPHDYIMEGVEEKEFRVPQNKIDQFVSKIILEVLEERFHLKIDYDGIEECLEKAYHPKNTELDDYLNEFHFEPFPLTFEEYADIQGCTEEEIAELRLDYEKVKKRFAERERAFTKMKNLKNFYTIDEIENNKKK